MCDRNQICKDEAQPGIDDRLSDETIYHVLILWLIKKALIEKEGDASDVETSSAIPRKDARGNRGLYDMDRKGLFNVKFPCKVYWGNGRYYKVFENARELLDYKMVLNSVGEDLKEYFFLRMKQEQSDKGNKNGDGTDRVFVRNPNMINEYINAGIRYNITYIKVLTDASRNGLLEKLLEILQMDKETIDRIMLDIKIEDEVSITIDNRQIVIAKKQRGHESESQSIWKLTYEFLNAIYEKLLSLDSAEIDYRPYTQVLNIIDSFCMSTAGRQESDKVNADSRILRTTSDAEKMFILDLYMNYISTIKEKHIGFMYQLGFLYKRLYTENRITVGGYYNEISNVGFQNWKRTIAEILEKGNAGDKEIDMHDFIPDTCEVLLSENEVREQIYNLEYTIQHIINRLNESRCTFEDQNEPRPAMMIGNLIKNFDNIVVSEQLDFNPLIMVLYYAYCIKRQETARENDAQIYLILRAYQLLLQVKTINQVEGDESINFVYITQRPSFYAYIAERFNIAKNGETRTEYLLGLCDEIKNCYSLIEESLSDNPINVAVEAQPGQPDESVPKYFEEQVYNNADDELESMYSRAGIDMAVQQHIDERSVEAVCRSILKQMHDKEDENRTLWDTIKQQVIDNDTEDIMIPQRTLQEQFFAIDRDFSTYLRAVALKFVENKERVK